MNEQKDENQPTEEQLPELVVKLLKNNKKKGGRKPTYPEFEKDLIAHLEEKIENRLKSSVKSLKIFAKKLRN